MSGMAAMARGAPCRICMHPCPCLLVNEPCTLVCADACSTGRLLLCMHAPRCCCCCAAPALTCVDTCSTGSECSECAMRPMNDSCRYSTAKKGTLELKQDARQSYNGRSALRTGERSVWEGDRWLDCGGQALRRSGGPCVTGNSAAALGLKQLRAPGHAHSMLSTVCMQLREHAGGGWYARGAGAGGGQVEEHHCSR